MKQTRMYAYLRAVGRTLHRFLLARISFIRRAVTPDL
jgi:hypothetical protein